MGGLSLTLETAKGTLLNSQISIQTASHNISNAENKTYARQRALGATNPAYLTSVGWLGTGAHLNTITQMRDSYLEMRLMGSVSDESQYSELSSQLSVAQTLFADDGESGISEAMGEFFDSWDILAQNPNSLTGKGGVYESATQFINRVQKTDDDLEAMLTEDIPNQIDSVAKKASDLISQIADYNLEIMKNESPDRMANDLRDLRYQAMTELSELIPIEYSEGTNGALNITMTDGTDTITLVRDGYASDDAIAYDTSTGVITYTDESGSATTGSENVSGGKLGGLFMAEDKIQAYRDKLWDFTDHFIQEVNTRQDDGSGGVFTGTTPDDIALVPNFLEGQDFATQTDRALQISSLQEQTITFTDGSTAKFSQYLSNIQSSIGADQRMAENQKVFSGSLQAELEAQQQSVSGVSIDEEMVDLLKHQQIYQAAAKIIQTADSLMQSVIDMV